MIVVALEVVCIEYQIRQRPSIAYSAVSLGLECIIKMPPICEAGEPIRKRERFHPPYADKNLSIVKRSTLTTVGRFELGKNICALERVRLRALIYIEGKTDRRGSSSTPTDGVA
jgi:hypothetical protein